MNHKLSATHNSESPHSLIQTTHKTATIKTLVYRPCYFHKAGGYETGSVSISEFLSQYLSVSFYHRATCVFSWNFSKKTTIRLWSGLKASLCCFWFLLSQAVNITRSIWDCGTFKTSSLVKLLGELYQNCWVHQAAFWTGSTERTLS